MRTSSLLALVAPALLLPLACEDASSSSGGTFNPEAGPGFEAGLSPEAGPVPEAGVDAPPAPLGVTVTVTDDALPLKDARVLLHDASGAVTGEKLTDATGKVTIATAPSMVTVLTARGTGPGSSVAPVTFMGVADGDKLVVAAATTFRAEVAPIGAYSVSFQNGAVVANANIFDVRAGAGCSAGGNDVAAPVLVDLYPDCVAAQNAVLVEASNGGGLQGFGFAKNVAKPAAGATTNVGPLAFAAPGATKLLATNVPVNAFASAQLFAVANGAAFDISRQSGALESPGGDTFVTPTGFADAYQSLVSYQKLNAASSSTEVFVRRETTTAPASATLPTFDFATALPLITDTTLAAPTPARPDVTITSASPLTTSDGGVVTLRWSVSVAETDGSWTFVLPPGSAAFKVPALPADAAAFVPAANVTVDDVTFIEASQVPGYKELKTLPIQPNFGVDLVNFSKPLPVPGTVRVTRWNPGVPG